MLWLGWLEAMGRVNPFTYDQDRSLRALIDVVPTGIPAEPPRHTHPLVRGVIPGISEEDLLLVWGGGVWNWLDPLTLIEAVARVVETHPQVRLYFPAPRHPYREYVPDMAMRQAAVELSRQLGLEGKNVFWGEWVPYRERQNYLLEADVGCSLHFETAESYFAFRTRVLDYIWAGLPMIVTRGDATSELVEEHGLGFVVDYEDVDGVVDAILCLMQIPREHFGERFEGVQKMFTWERNAEPLVRFCRDPRRAPDKEALGKRQQQDLGLDQIARQEQEIARLHDIVAGYERGRFIRFTKWLRRMTQRLRGSESPTEESG
jgi:glycosyltransferase involved in cell wall biosynthesis